MLGWGGGTMIQHVSLAITLEDRHELALLRGLPRSRGPLSTPAHGFSSSSSLVSATSLVTLAISIG